MPQAPFAMVLYMHGAISFFQVPKGAPGLSHLEECSWYKYSNILQSTSSLFIRRGRNSYKVLIGACVPSGEILTSLGPDDHGLQYGER